MAGKRLVGYKKAHTKAPPKARARIKKRSRTRGGRNSDPKKLAWLRTKPCLIRKRWGEGAACGGIVEVHHDRPMGARATDRRTVALCETHHRTGPRSVQNIGRAKFQSFYGIDLDHEIDLYEANKP